MLIGITGHRGSGKDALASWLPSRLTRMRFAGPLKEMMRTLYQEAGVSPEEAEARIEGHLKNSPDPVLLGATPRHAMQTIGTEWRDMIHTRLWSNIFHEKVARMLKAGASIVCTDMRFFHELEVIHHLGGFTVRVIRPGQVNSDPHPSEADIPLLPVDMEVVNDGSLEDLATQAALVMERVTFRNGV